MPATSLAPEGYLSSQRVSGAADDQALKDEQETAFSRDSLFHR
jgi:hypothetical protein